jgi:TonB family protein
VSSVPMAFLWSAFIWMGLVGTPGQNPCPLPQPGEPVPFCRLDDRPHLDYLTAPRYPAVLYQAGVSGKVRLAFVVDTTGRVIRNSFRTLSASNPQFAAPAREAMLNHHFYPPRHAGSPVSASVEVEFTFTLGPDSVPSRYSVTTQRMTEGYRVRVAWEPVPLAVPAVVLAAADSAGAYRAMLLDQWTRPDSTRRILCISVSGKDPDSAALASLRQFRENTVPQSQCPPTYSGMLPRRAPAGALDPDWLSVGGLEVWTADLVTVTVVSARGSVRMRYVCDVSRTPGSSQWEVERCRRYRYSVS